MLLWVIFHQYSVCIYASLLLLHKKSFECASLISVILYVLMWDSVFFMVGGLDNCVKLWDVKKIFAEIDPDELNSTPAAVA